MRVLSQGLVKMYQAIGYSVLKNGKIKLFMKGGFEDSKTAYEWLAGQAIKNRIVVPYGTSDPVLQALLQAVY